MHDRINFVIREWDNATFAHMVSPAIGKNQLHVYNLQESTIADTITRGTVFHYSTVTGHDIKVHTVQLYCFNLFQNLC